MSSTGRRYNTYQSEPDSETDTGTEVSTDVEVAYRRPGQNVRGKLPPLETSNRLPPVDPAFQVTNIHSAQTQEAIISFPAEDRGRDEKVHSVGMPRIGSNSSQQKPLEIVVYFMDKTGIHLVVDDGQNCQAGELFEMVREEMKFPESSREVFSLWLVSDLLEVQLKPNQVPFKLACYWEELLEKYTTADEDDIERDEAVIMFQRNVFYPRSKEKQIEDAEILRLLYHEAKESVVDARYPLEKAQYEHLSGLQALINHRTYDENIHTPEYYKPLLCEYFPEFVANKKKWSLFRGKDCPEYQLASCHAQSYRTYGQLTNIEARKKCYTAYLEFCWKLPYYGAAFFRGQIEHPGGKMRLRSLEDDPVYIAINTEGVYITDMDDVKFLMGLMYHEFSWEYAEPRDQENKNCMPCLFIRFGAREEGERVTKMLQVFSREAVLMDSMIEACVNLKGTKRSNKDSTGGIIQSTGETWQDFNRLCLATFNSSGQMVKSKARIPKKK